MVRPDVDGIGEARFHQFHRALDCIINITVRSGLHAISPERNRPGVSSLDDLSAEGCRRLFSSSLVGAMGAVDIVVSGYAYVEIVISLVGLTHLFVLVFLAYMEYSRHSVVW